MPTLSFYARPWSGSPAAFIHASNLLTYVSLLCGLAALALALAYHAPGAGALLAASVIADTFDGKFARWFTRRPELVTMGVQLDSLSDAVSFGVAPVVCATVLMQAGERAGLVWWGSAFAYTACALTRLGFYNVTEACTRGFIGLPTPVAALLWSSIFLFSPGPALGVSCALSTAVAMIAPLRIPRPSGVGLFLFVLWPIALIVLHLTGLFQRSF
jgi:phosphatidylserine synthase